MIWYFDALNPRASTNFANDVVIAKLIGTERTQLRSWLCNLRSAV
jgi:hypothetical protein